MPEGHGRVMGEALLDEDVTVEAPHLPHRENPDPAERLGIDVQDLALGHVGAEHGIGRGLQAEDCDVAGLDPALECPARDVGVLSGLQEPVHDELEFHLSADHAEG